MHLLLFYYKKQKNIKKFYYSIKVLYTLYLCLFFFLFIRASEIFEFIYLSHRQPTTWYRYEKSYPTQMIVTWLCFVNYHLVIFYSNPTK